MLPKLGKVLVADPIAEEGQILLRMRADVDIELKLTPERLEAIIGDYDALVVRSRTKVTAPIIAAGQRLRVIGRAGVGIDNIDLEAARERGITVINTPDASSVSVAELTLGLILSVARNIPQANAAVRGGHWAPGRYRGVELAGRTLGIVGLGRIGRAVAARALGFDLQVVAHDPVVTGPLPELPTVKLCSLKDVLVAADFLTIHVPLLPGTVDLIDEQALKLMKPTAFLICCARGGIVNEDSLLRALQENRLAGAALDVFSTEPPGANPLLQDPRVISTPHLGALTREAQTKAAIDVAWGVIDVLRGHTPRYQVVVGQGGASGQPRPASASSMDID